MSGIGGILHSIEGSFTWSTEEPHADNMETMNQFLEDYLPEDADVFRVYGTQAIVLFNAKTFELNASGNGSFFEHVVEWTEVKA